MLLDGDLRVLERLLDGGNLRLAVHEEGAVRAHLFADGVSHLRLDLLDGGGLVTGLLRGDVIRLPHPGDGHFVTGRTLHVLFVRVVLLQKVLVLLVQGGRDQLAQLVLLKNNRKMKRPKVNFRGLISTSTSSGFS